MSAFLDVICGECGRLIGEVTNMEEAAQRYLSHLELSHPERFAELEREGADADAKAIDDYLDGTPS